MDSRTIEPAGPFDLTRSISFLEEWPATRRPADGAALRFAFCAEHDWRPVGVRVTQHGGAVTVAATRGAGDVVAEVARILSLDVDATAVRQVVDRDRVVAELVAAAPGLRPVCFWTPWEAACWALLTQRTSMRTAAALKRRIGDELGTTVEVDGEALTAFPAPRTVLDAPRLPGVDPTKLDRVRALAAAALDGTLTTATLRGLAPDEARAALRALPGVGPFSADLILIRGAGAPDVFTTNEPRLLAAVRRRYGLPDSAGVEDCRAIAERWRPLRSWVGFWLRASAVSSGNAPN